VQLIAVFASACNDSRLPVSRVESLEFIWIGLNWSRLQETFLTVAEIAEQLKLNPQTIRNWIDRGSLPAVRVGPRQVRVRESDLDAFLNQGATPRAEESAPMAPPEQELLSRRTLANRLRRSGKWVDDRVREGMPFEPPNGDYPHRRFRLPEVNLWLEQHAASQRAPDGDDPERADVAQLASALADATSAALDGDQSQLTDALRMVANTAERLADALERAPHPS
jgi:excisionase family DNA binding protein